MAGLILEDMYRQITNQSFFRSVDNEYILRGKTQVLHKIRENGSNMSTKSTTGLNINNFLNVAAFALSFVLNYEDGQENKWYNGLSSLFPRYESLMTPADVTLILSKVILVFEGVFTVVQLLPNYRGNDLVQKCVRKRYFILSVAQLLWSIDFNLENMWGSFVSTALMTFMFVAVSKILISQAQISDPLTQTHEEYWLLRFPFNIHCGYIMANFVSSINAMFVQIGFGAAVQFVVAFISIGLFVLAGYKFLFVNGRHGNYAIPSVLSIYLVSQSSFTFE